MRFDGVFGVKWGSMWFAEVQCGSQGFFEVHLGSVRFDGAFGIKWGSMGSIWFVEVQYGLQGFFGVKCSSMVSMWFAGFLGVGVGVGAKVGWG